MFGLLGMFNAAFSAMAAIAPLPRNFTHRLILVIQQGNQR
jgi:hypothetical protein